MEQRGRKSAASLEVANHSVTEVHRPGPSSELSAEEKAEWMVVVNDLPADWFRDSNLVVLEGYCRTAVNCRRIAQLIERCIGADEFDLNEYDKLLKMQETQHRALLSFATKMRLTQQATYDKERRKSAKRTLAPYGNRSAV
jgi:hypothetical protein